MIPMRRCAPAISVISRARRLGLGVVMLNPLALDASQQLGPLPCNILLDNRMGIHSVAGSSASFMAASTCFRNHLSWFGAGCLWLLSLVIPQIRLVVLAAIIDTMNIHGAVQHLELSIGAQS
jgi:hypothetical protein